MRRLTYIRVIGCIITADTGNLSMEKLLRLQKSCMVPYKLKTKKNHDIGEKKKSASTGQGQNFL
jgi:hypothetical protein